MIYNRETALAILIIRLFVFFAAAPSLPSILVAAVPSINPVKLSPIKNWESSHAASAADSSIIILNFSQNSALCVIRRPKRRVLTSAQTTLTVNHAWLMKDELRVRPLHSDEWTQNTINPRWNLLGTNVLCCMTGLASDVDFLLRTLQKKVDVERIIYEGSQSGQLSLLLRECSTVLREATRWHDGRPYGVQVLLLGIPKSKKVPLQLYSLDPSGGYWKWPTATAIGNNAHLIRKQLSLQLQENENMTARSALAKVLAACRWAMEEATYSSENDNYEVLLLKRDVDEFKVYVIHEEDILNCLSTKRS